MDDIVDSHDRVRETTSILVEAYDAPDNYHEEEDEEERDAGSAHLHTTTDALHEHVNHHGADSNAALDLQVEAMVYAEHRKANHTKQVQMPSVPQGGGLTRRHTVSRQQQHVTATM